MQAYLNDIRLQVELRTYDWPTYVDHVAEAC